MCITLFVPLTSARLVLAAGFENGSLLLIDVVSGSLLSSLRVHQEPLLCMSVCPDRNLLVSGAAEKKVGAVDLTDLAAIREVETQIELKSTGLADIRYRADAKIFATAGWDSKYFRCFPQVLVSQCKLFFPTQDSDISGQELQTPGDPGVPPGRRPVSGIFARTKVEYDGGGIERHSGLPLVPVLR